MSGRDERNEYYLHLIKKAIDTSPDWVKTYLNGFNNYLNSLSLVTKYHYVLYAKMFLNTVNKPIEDLVFNDFSDFLAEMKYDENGKMNTSSHQVVLYSSMKKFCAYLCAIKVIPENYVSSMDRPKSKDSMETVEKRQNGYLSEGEIKDLVELLDYGCDHFEGERRIRYLRDRAVIQTFLNTGIRKSALIGIDINNVDLKRHTLIVTEKEDKVRLFELSDRFCGILKEWIKEREMLLGELESNALFLCISNRVFDGEKYFKVRRITETEVEDLVNYHCGYIEGKHITPHKLRATYGTQLYNKTRDIYFVQECMGHSSPQTTEKYIRGDRQSAKRASDIMAELT